VPSVSYTGAAGLSVAPGPSETKAASGLNRLHIVIRQPEYLAGTADRPELGVLTQAHAGRRPVPWGQIDQGDELLVKLASGPIVARASVQGFRVFEGCDAHTLRRAVLGFGLHDLDGYWEQLPARFWGMAIFTSGESWLAEPYVPRARSRGASWIVAQRPDLERWQQPGRIQGDEMSDQLTDARPSRTIPARLRFYVLRRDGFACTYCGRRAQVDGVVLHIDHVIPVRAGGLTVLENLRTACAACNLGKGASPLFLGSSSSE
jgi:HNH endonuclease